jgi:hypothetical protein
MLFSFLDNASFVFYNAALFVLNNMLDYNEGTQNEDSSEQLEVFRKILFGECKTRIAASDPVDRCMSNVEDLLSCLLGISSLICREDYSREPLGLTKDTEPDIYEDLARKEQSVQALSKLFFTHWSDSFLHSSDMSFALIRFSETLLDDDEVFVRMESMEFRKVVNTQLEMHAWIGDETAFDFEDNRKPAVKGSLKTSNGRTINLMAFQSELPVSQKFMIMNPFLHQKDRGRRPPKIQDSFGGCFKFSICLENDSPIDDFRWSSHTVQELVLMGFKTLEKDTSCIPSQGLAGGFSSFRFPKISQLSGKCQMYISLQEEKSVMTPKGYRLLPCELCFLNEKGVEIGGGTYTHILTPDDLAFKDLVSG